MSHSKSEKASVYVVEGDLTVRGPWGGVRLSPGMLPFPTELLPVLPLLHEAWRREGGMDVPTAVRRAAALAEALREMDNPGRFGGFSEDARNAEAWEDAARGGGYEDQGEEYCRALAAELRGRRAEMVDAVRLAVAEVREAAEAAMRTPRRAMPWGPCPGIPLLPVVG